MRYKMIVFNLLVITLVGCSKEFYTVEQARENGDIIVHMDEAVVENLERFATFQQSVDNKKSDEVFLTFNSHTRKGEAIQSRLTTKNGFVTFESNFTGYHYPDTKTGTFTCKYLTVLSGSVFVESCTSEDGKKINTVFAFRFDSERSKKLGIHY